MKLWVGFVRMAPGEKWKFFCSAKSWRSVADQFAEAAPTGTGISWVILAQEWGKPHGPSTIPEGDSPDWDGKTWGTV